MLEYQFSTRVQDTLGRFDLVLEDRSCVMPVNKLLALVNNQLAATQRQNLDRAAMRVLRRYRRRQHHGRNR
ncbi:hypothetical protein J7394_04520 [Ruegeria sp. R13_0]|uniref:hypothetical protein n=1 Tax=Ruegeria sp. R13_0 TaxID=2821099 RepID=UPI001ADD5EDE|nr:hypothetical protein [Ruegeria sp. R13_0]MBO9433453.1 hypothetical protein [Ruegeria sp. R13_0]